MANPFAQIEDAAVTKEKTVTSIVDAFAFNGESPELMLQVAGARAGGVCWTDVFGGERDFESPRANDRSVAIMEISVVVPNLGGRNAAGAAGKQVVWDVYKAMVGQTLSLSWLWPLQYRAWERTKQGQNAAIFKLILATQFDMALWT